MYRVDEDREINHHGVSLIVGEDGAQQDELEVNICR